MYKERAFQGWEQVDGDTPEVGYCAEEAYCAEVDVEVLRRGKVDFSASLWATCCCTRLTRVDSSKYAPPCGSWVSDGTAYVLTLELFGCRAERKTPSDTTLMANPSNSVTVPRAKCRDKINYTSETRRVLSVCRNALIQHLWNFPDYGNANETDDRTAEVNFALTDIQRRVYVAGRIEEWVESVADSHVTWSRLN